MDDRNDSPAVGEKPGKAGDTEDVPFIAGTVMRVVHDGTTWKTHSLIARATGKEIWGPGDDFDTQRTKWRAYLTDLDRQDFEAGRIDKPPDMTWDQYWRNGGKPW